MAGEYGGFDTPIELQAYLDSIGAIKTRYDTLGKALESLKNRTDVLSLAEKDAADLRKTTKNAEAAYKKRLDELRQTVIASGGTYRDYEAQQVKVTAEYKSYIEELKKGSPASQKLAEEMLNNADEIEKNSDKQAKNNVQITLATSLLKSFGRGLDGVVRAYQSGASDISFGSSILSTAITEGASATSAIAGAAGAAGTGLATFGSKIPRVGGAVALFGQGLELAAPFISKFAGGLSEVAQKVLPILTQELEKNYNAFNAISSSGAVFADGLVGMAAAGKAVNLALPDFADVLQQNAQSLAASGLGMTTAAQQMGRVGMVMKQTGVTNELLRLGISFKEQAGLISDTMANFASTNRLRGASEQQLSQYTNDYATNLKVLSGITGEDAKKALERNRRAAFDADVYAKLQKMGPDAVAKFQSQLEIFNKTDPTGKLGEAFKQQFAGITNSTDPAIRSLMQMPEVSAGFRDSISSLNDPTKTMAQTSADTAGAIGKMREELSQNVGRFTNISAAARAGVGGIVADINTVVGNILSTTSLNKEAVQAQMADVEAQKKASGDLTQSMVGAVEASNEAKLTIQDTFLKTGVLGAFADGITGATKALKKLIEEFGGTTGTSSGTGGGSNLSLGGALEGAATGATIGSAVPLIGTTAGAVIGGVVGSGVLSASVEAAVNNARLANPMNDQDIATQLAAAGAGGASGMISSGPITGYFAKLHGTEAVLPADLTKILTDVSENYANNSLNNISNDDITRATNNSDSTKFAEASANFLETLNRKMDLLISATVEVARYTKDTSVRIT